MVVLHPLRDFTILLSVLIILLTEYKKHKKNMKNWKTSLLGTITVVLIYLLSTNVITEPFQDYVKALAGVTGLLFAIASKDWDVTGFIKMVVLVCSLTFVTKESEAQTGQTFKYPNIGNGFLSPRGFNAIPIALNTDTVFNNTDTFLLRPPYNQGLIIYSDTSNYYYVIVKRKPRG